MTMISSKTVRMEEEVLTGIKHIDSGFFMRFSVLNGRETSVQSISGIKS